MSIWLREIVGWILLGCGVGAFAMCYFVFLLNHWFLEGGIAAFAGFVIFRAGMHLLKVALAARAASDIRAELQASGSATRRIRPALAKTTNGRPRSSVVPGQQS